MDVQSVKKQRISNIKYDIKSTLRILFEITFAYSLVTAIHLAFFISSHPEHLFRSFPVLKKVFLLNNTFLFQFLISSILTVACLLMYLVIYSGFSLSILIIYKMVLSGMLSRFPDVKGAVKKYLFLFYLLPVLYTSEIIGLKIIYSRYLSNIIFLPFLYLALAIIAVLIYRKIRGQVDIAKFFAFTFSAFLAVPCSIELFSIFYTKFDIYFFNEIPLFLFAIALSAVIVARLCRRFSSDKPLYIQRKAYLRTASAIVRACAALILISLVLSLASFVVENQQRRIIYRAISSSARKDINVILITLDALRSDHLGCYGYGIDTSPHIDKFAQSYALFKNCYSQASWTIPSIASLFTSLYPSMHNAVVHGSVLPDKVTTLVELMQQAGYLTYAFTANAGIHQIFNCNKGKSFDFFDNRLLSKTTYEESLRSLLLFKYFILGLIDKEVGGFEFDGIRKFSKSRIIPWLLKYKSNNFFMYLHFMDTHKPYWAPLRYKTIDPVLLKDKVLGEISLYDSTIRFTDDYINALLQELKALGIYDKTLIIITADHGEVFGGSLLDKLGHGYSIYQGQLKVPLLIKPPCHSRKF